MTALDYLNRINSVDIVKLGAEVINEHAEELVELQRRQLVGGKRSDGSEVLPNYSPITIELKQQKSGIAAITSNVTTFDTGAFHNSIDIQAQASGNVLTTAFDPKAEKLSEKYDTARGSLLGLNEDSKEIAKEDFLQDGIKKKIQQTISTGR